MHRILYCWLATLLLLMMTPAKASGPNTRFKNLSVEHGLSQASVISISQDNQGFMWFGTQDGLNRYDGYQFKTFRHNPQDPHSLANNWIWSLYKDAQGRLWIGSELGGLDRYDPATQQFIHHRFDHNNPHSLSNNDVRAIVGDNQGILWVGTHGGGLNRFDVDDGQFEHFRHDPSDPTSIASDNIKTLHIDSAGTLWVGTDVGLTRFDRDSSQFSHFRHRPDDPLSIQPGHVRAVYEDQRKRLWIGTSSGLSRFSPDTAQFEHFEHQADTTDQTVVSIVEDDRRRLWVGTLQGGLSRFDAKRRRFDHFRQDRSAPDSLSHNRMQQLYKTGNGAIWIGTDGGGVNHIAPNTKRFDHFKQTLLDPHSLSNNKVWAIHQSSQGTLWIGTEHGLNRYDDNNGQFVQYLGQTDAPTSLSHSSIRAIVEDNQGIVWLATHGGGLNRFDPQQKTFQHFLAENPEDNYIQALVQEAPGIFWLGTHEHGLMRLNTHTGESEHFNHDGNDSNSLSANSVWALHRSPDGTLWVGTSNGLNRFDRHTGRFHRYHHQYEQPGSLSHDAIRSFYQDKHGHLWVGTAGGLNRYNPKQDNFVSYTQNTGLPNDVILAMVEDDFGQLWVSTGKGLSRFDQVSQTFRNYDVKDGLQGDEFSVGAAFKGLSGELYFGGNNGFNRFLPEDIEDDWQTPAVVLTEFLLANQPVPILRDVNPDGFTLPNAIDTLTRLDLSYRENLLSFEFAALHFANPLKNQYAYKLAGLSDEWITTDAKNRRATFTNLPAGDYILHVKAANPDGFWNDEGTQLAIHVSPPPWQTWWAYTLYVLLLTLPVITLVIAQRRKIRYEHNLNLQLKEVDKLKDEFLANTSHELRTPLNGIIGLAESLIDGAAGSLPDVANHNLAMLVGSGKRLSNLVNDLLDFSQLKHQNLILDTKPVDLHTMVDVVLSLSRPLLDNRKNGQKPLKLTNNVPQTLPAAEADENRLQQILHNLVGNAIKFTDVGEIKVSAQHHQDMLTITISDTGIGISRDQLDDIFESFKQLDGSIERMTGGCGLGLAVSQQLVELHGGELTVESEPGLGSSFAFTLPVAAERALPVTSEMQTVSKVNFVEEESQVTALNAPHPGGRLSQHTKSDSSRFRILLVDDEPVNRQVLNNHLSLQNYDLFEAASGEQALLAVRQNGPFDLILLDIMMPKMSGYEVCRHLREEFPVNDLPIIFLTAKNQVSDLVQSFSVGANDYLTKPISKHELLYRVEVHLKLLDINRNLEDKVKQRTNQLQQSNHRLKALSEISTQIGSSLDFEKVLHNVYRHIKELMNVDTFTIGLFDPAKRRLVFKLSIENDKPLPEFEVSLREEERPAVWCLKNRQPLILNDYERDYPKIIGKPTPPGSMVGIQNGSVIYWPLVASGHITGVLSVQCLRVGAYNETQQEIIRGLASTTAIALDKANAYREVEEKNRALIATQQQLVQSEKMASLGTLTAGVAHEINNPNNFVYVTSQLLENELQKFREFLFELAEDADEAILESFSEHLTPLFEHIQTIYKGSQRITHIVRDLRVFSQLDAAERQSVLVSDLLLSAINLVKVKNESIATFDTHFKTTPKIDCYPAQLNQVFMNIILNACEAINRKQQCKLANNAKGCKANNSEKGKIVISSQLLDEDDNAKLQVTISDDGCGMDKTAIDKVFEPFYTTKDIGTGTGLGLSIAYGIIQQHQGELLVSSKPGVGSTFTLLLPCAMSEELVD